MRIISSVDPVGGMSKPAPVFRRAIGPVVRLERAWPRSRDLATARIAGHGARSLGRGACQSRSSGSEPRPPNRPPCGLRVVRPRPRTGASRPIRAGSAASARITPSASRSRSAVGRSIEHADQPGGPGPFDVLGQVVDEHAVARLGPGGLGAGEVEGGRRLDVADLVGEDEPVEMRQGLGELAAELAGVEVVGVRAEDQGVPVRLRTANSGRDRLVGREDVGPGRGELVVGDRQADQSETALRERLGRRSGRSRTP